jgi:hypothetical protein
MTEAQVVIVGDVWPTLAYGSVAASLGLKTEPELFIWTLDGAIEGAESHKDRACLGFTSAALAPLAYGKTSLAVTASNHVTDFGEAGVAATLQALDQHGIRHVGAGLHRQQAEIPAVIEIANRRLIVLSFAETEPRVGAFAATVTRAGVRPLVEEESLHAIEQAKKQADWVWVVLHWGTEFVRFPDADQRQLARRMMAAGASLVVGSHVHVPLGYEDLATGPVFYGLGNFVFPDFREPLGYEYRWHPTARRGVVLMGKYGDGAWQWNTVGVRLDAKGLPHRVKQSRCPNYALKLPADLRVYRSVYERLKRRERWRYLCERLCFMTWQERAVHLKGIFS